MKSRWSFTAAHIDELAVFVEHADDPVKFLRAINLASNSENHLESLSSKERGVALTHALRRLAQESRRRGFNWIGRTELVKFCERILTREADDKRTTVEGAIYELRRYSDCHSMYRFDKAYEIDDPTAFNERIILQEVEFLHDVERSTDTFLETLWAEGLLPLSIIDRAQDSSETVWLTTAATELLQQMKLILASSDPRPLPRDSATLAFAELGRFIGNPEKHENAVQSALGVLERERKRWIESREQEKARLHRLVEAELREKEAHDTIWRIRFQIASLGIFVVFMLVCMTWLTWKYLVPRLHVSALDVSQPEHVRKLLIIAGDEARDMALRRVAIRKLALSDDVRADRGLRELAERDAVPEALRIEAQRAMHQQGRRQMRRAALEF